jgi:hypothetical protein
VGEGHRKLRLRKSFLRSALPRLNKDLHVNVSVTTAWPSFFKDSCRQHINGSVLYKSQLPVHVVFTLYFIARKLCSHWKITANRISYRSGSQPFSRDQTSVFHSLFGPHLSYCLIIINVLFIINIYFLTALLFITLFVYNIMNINNKKVY